MLNVISSLLAFTFGTGVIYLIFHYTIGRLKFLDSKFEWNGLQIKDFVFLGIGAFIILFFFSFYLPYK